ncbi:MAG: NERD domain-containing protein [Chloroflexi bacterium]|nr:MAG: NERD domain-containing protein [Chloroflexota bacterium]
MNVVTNEKLIKRNTRIAQIAGLAGMGVLIAGMVVLFRYPEQVMLTWLTVLGGFLLSQVGIYFTNRYGRRPRPDEQINSSLKGLDHNFTIYHYKTPTSHLLVGPAGIWVIVPRYQKGVITYEKGRYKQKTRNFMQGYMRIFGQEGLGRPELEVESEKENINRFLKKRLPDVELPPVQAALVFTSEQAVLENVDEAENPTIPVKKLKDVVRKAAKTKSMGMDKVKAINEVIGENGKN